MCVCARTRAHAHALIFFTLLLSLHKALPPGNEWLRVNITPSSAVMHLPEVTPVRMQ